MSPAAAFLILFGNHIPKSNTAQPKPDLSNWPYPPKEATPCVPQK